MQRVVIFGIGDFGQVAHAYLSSSKAHDIAAFTVHGRHITAPELLGRPVVPFEELEMHFPPSDVQLVLAVGYSRLNRERAHVFRAAKARGYVLASYVDPRAHLTGETIIGEGCFIFEDNVIQPFVTIGDNVVMWSGNHVGHHCRIGDHCFIASHAVIAGRVSIGDNCFIGVNATIRDGVTIGSDCIIGAAATILKDTGDGEVYRASTTRPASTRSRRWRI